VLPACLELIQHAGDQFPLGSILLTHPSSPSLFFIPLLFYNLLQLVQHAEDGKVIGWPASTWLEQLHVVVPAAVLRQPANNHIRLWEGERKKEKESEI
jgi:hypothetical protein